MFAIRKITSLWTSSAAVMVSAIGLAALSPAQADTGEYCAQMMSGFPNTEMQNRYHFFTLVNHLTEGYTEDLDAAVVQFSNYPLEAGTPVVDVIEEIVDPVLRQADPTFGLSQVRHLIQFGQTCREFTSSQLNAIELMHPEFTEPEFQLGIVEDALFIRSVLSDALRELRAHEDPVHGRPVLSYERETEMLRDTAERTLVKRDMDNLYAEFEEDIEQRFAMVESTDVGTTDTEATSTAVKTWKDLNNASRRERRAEAAQIFKLMLVAH